MYTILQKRTQNEIKIKIKMAILKCKTNKFSGGQAQMIKYLPRPREKN